MSQGRTTDAPIDEGACDELAKVLRQLGERFGDTAFTDRRRLVSLLSDKLPEEARREIRVVASAVDERVFSSLTQARPEQLAMEIDRLAARLEGNLGIRGDVAQPVVRACAYGLGLGPLPSASGWNRATPAAMANSVPRPPGEDSWVGGTQGIGSGGRSKSSLDAGAPPEGKAGSVSTAAAPKGRRWIIIGGVAVVVLIGAYVGIGNVQLIDERGGQTAPNPQKPQPRPDQPVPASPQPVAQPAREPAPVPAPTPEPIPAPPRAQQPTPQPRQPAPAITPISRPQQPAGTQIPDPAPTANQFGYANELLDYNVPPQAALRPDSDVGTPTPTQIPGAHVVTTQGIVAEMRKGTQFLFLDVLASQHPETALHAQWLPGAGAGGSFGDRTQQQFGAELNQFTGGRKDQWVVFFCQGPICWESYNAALRAVALGYRNVLWYRGGLAAWDEARLPMQPTQARHQ